MPTGETILVTPDVDRDPAIDRSAGGVNLVLASAASNERVEKG